MGKKSIEEAIPNTIALSLSSIVESLDELSEIEFDSIKTDREERGGVLCYDPKKKSKKIIKVDATNDYAVNSPDITIGQIGELCPKGNITTFWHTHGMALHSFSDMDRYSAGDIAASGNQIGLCSLGIDALQCHYAFTTVPEVVNIKWDGKIRKHLKKSAQKTYMIDDLLCDGGLNCRARIWSEDMTKKPVGTYDQVNALDGTVSWADGSGIVVSGHNSMECYEMASKDGFVSLNCYGREKNEKKNSK